MGGKRGLIRALWVVNGLMYALLLALMGYYVWASLTGRIHG